MMAGDGIIKRLDLSAPLIDHSAIRDQQRELARRGKVISDASEYQLRSAELTCSYLLDHVASFEAGLAADEEAFICVIGGPSGLMIFPQSIQYVRPDKLVFSGIDDSGRRVSAVQHVSQLSVMLQAIPVEPGEEARRTGFHDPV